MSVENYYVYKKYIYLNIYIIYIRTLTLTIYTILNTSMGFLKCQIPSSELALLSIFEGREYYKYIDKY